MNVAKEKLVSIGVELLSKKGVLEEDALYLSETAVKIEAFGIKTHGVVLFAYWDDVVGTVIDPKAKPEVVKEKGASALIDGKNSFGQLSLKLAKEIAVKKAKANGIAMVGGNNSFWLGALGPQIVSLSEAGFFAQIWAQTNTCKDSAPWGGIDANFSTNPVALTFPAGDVPMVSDFSTSAMSLGKVNTMVRKKEKAPENLFLDKDGIPTTDPNVVSKGGSIFFMGGERYGYKGYALSLWTEALTAMGGGDANNPEKPSRQCYNLTVIDPEAFAGQSYYQTEIKRFLAHMKDSRLRPGFEAILLPGERASKEAQEADSKGIPLEEMMIDKLNAVAKKNNIAEI